MAELISSHDSGTQGAEDAAELRPLKRKAPEMVTAKAVEGGSSPSNARGKGGTKRRSVTLDAMDSSPSPSPSSRSPAGMDEEGGGQGGGGEGGDGDGWGEVESEALDFGDRTKLSAVKWLKTRLRKGLKEVKKGSPFPNDRWYGLFSEMIQRAHRQAQEISFCTHSKPRFVYSKEYGKNSGTAFKADCGCDFCTAWAIIADMKKQVQALL